MIETGQLVLLISPKGKRYVRPFDPEEVLNTHDGQLDMGQVADKGFGRTALTHLGRPYRVVKPTLYDLIKTIKRKTQIIYPKDIGYILLKLGIGPGCRVIEAGSGSGSLTLALAWSVGEEGCVYTHERRPEFAALCAANLAAASLGHRVEHVDRDIADGFALSDADALFLDVRTPWDYLEQVAAAVKPGSPLGFLLPTVGQVSELLFGLEKGPFEDVEVMEILLRRWKPQAERLRPDDRMVAHTGFLVFAREGGEGPVEAEEAGQDIPDETSGDGVGVDAG